MHDLPFEAPAGLTVSATGRTIGTIILISLAARIRAIVVLHSSGGLPGTSHRDAPPDVA